MGNTKRCNIYIYQYYKLKKVLNNKITIVKHELYESIRKCDEYLILISTYNIAYVCLNEKTKKIIK
jgi:hypothetical protein